MILQELYWYFKMSSHKKVVNNKYCCIVYNDYTICVICILVNKIARYFCFFKFSQQHWIIRWRGTDFESWHCLYRDAARETPEVYLLEQWMFMSITRLLTIRSESTPIPIQMQKQILGACFTWEIYFGSDHSRGMKYIADCASEAGQSQLNGWILVKYNDSAIKCWEGQWKICSW